VAARARNLSGDTAAMTSLDPRFDEHSTHSLALREFWHE
jgi:hypothetical protein